MNFDRIVFKNGSIIDIIPTSSWSSTINNIASEPHRCILSEDERRAVSERLYGPSNNETMLDNAAWADYGDNNPYLYFNEQDFLSMISGE